jgi:hypothetical protein
VADGELMSKQAKKKSEPKYTPPETVYVSLSWDLGYPNRVTTMPHGATPVEDVDGKLGPFRYVLARTCRDRMLLDLKTAIVSAKTRAKAAINVDGPESDEWATRGAYAEGLEEAYNIVLKRRG